jgi:hypothetical protein
MRHEQTSNNSDERGKFQVDAVDIIDDDHEEANTSYLPLKYFSASQ